MTASLPPLTRRRLFAALAGPLVLGRGRGARAASQLSAPVAAVPAVPFPDGVEILVAGPQGGLLGHWGEVVGAALGDALPAGTRVRTTCAGGTDGVTAANQFEARVPPDGSTVLLTPGAAALNWLAGDPRAHFDAGHWVPVMAGIAPAVVVIQSAVMPLRRDQTVRLAASSPIGPQLPALLAFDLLGLRLAPVFGLMEQNAVIAAFAERKVDAVLACGQNVPAQLARLQQCGGQAAFVLGALSGGEAPAHDLALPGVPTFVELHVALRGTQPHGPRYHAYRAAAAATQLEFGLMLPQLTPAAMVSLWRRAAGRATEAPSVQALAASVSVQPLEGIAAAAAATSVAANTAALLDLRGWLASRLHWRPS